MRLNQVTVTVTDIESASAFYRTLGLKTIVKSPHYARFECPQGESTFSIHLGEVSAVASTVVYFENEQLDAVVKKLKSEGITFDSEPADQRWLWREARLRDPSGNPICLFHAGDNRLNPPWRLPEVVS
ncbi:MAG: VOC family protein [Betaproteobacteria bacterium]|nr:VOC family protein [Betaproteobacteria bacterium]